MKEPRLWTRVFWADDLSISDGAAIHSERLAGPKQITDVYLTALALRRGGRLVTPSGYLRYRGRMAVGPERDHMLAKKIVPTPSITSTPTRIQPLIPMLQ
jgi:hypothetical protein